VHVPASSRAAAVATAPTRAAEPTHDWWFNLPQTLEWFPPLLWWRSITHDNSGAATTWRRKCFAVTRLAHNACMLLLLTAVPLVLVARFEYGASVPLLDGVSFPWGVAFLPVWAVIACFACCCCTIRFEEDFIPFFIGIWTFLLLPLTIVLILVAVSLDSGRGFAMRLVFIPFWLWMACVVACACACACACVQAARGVRSNALHGPMRLPAGLPPAPASSPAAEPSSAGSGLATRWRSASWAGSPWASPS